jgi:hypothetical protein
VYNAAGLRLFWGKEKEKPNWMQFLQQLLTGFTNFSPNANSFVRANALAQNIGQGLQFG